MGNDTKKCPFCAETIKAEAIFCRYCRRDLPQASLVPVPEEKGGIKWGYIVWLVVIGVIIVILIAGQLTQSSHRPQPSFQYPSVPEKYTVIYKVAGMTTRAALTYENAQGGTEQADVQVPWQKSFTFDEGDFVYISAANRNDRGTVVCEIWVDGKKWKESTSQGAYTIATCSGSVGRD